MMITSIMMKRKWGIFFEIIWFFFMIHHIIRYGKKMRVENFHYNGFTVKPKKGIAKYTAEFKRWSDSDPGIVICKCSDGKERLIPSCCLIGFFKLPKAPKIKPPEKGVILGVPSSSNDPPLSWAHD